MTVGCYRRRQVRTITKPVSLPPRAPTFPAMRFLPLLCLASIAASAATIPGSFQQIDCDGGGWFEQIIPHASGRLYGRTDVGGLYRSDDHGDSWQFVSGDFSNQASYFVQGEACRRGSAHGE